jgi:hypothetical protein
LTKVTILHFYDETGQDVRPGLGIADVWALDGKYYRKDPEYLPKLLLKTWTKMFERVP